MPTATPKSTKAKSTKPASNRTPGRGIPESVVERSLQLSSQKAARVWTMLNSGVTDPADLLPALQKAQGQQENAVDIHVTLRQHIDAEIAAAQARRDALIAVHDADIKRLKEWAATLDQGVLDMREQGLISDETNGETYRIRIKLNPPSCDILDENLIPDEFVEIETVRKPDKKAIKAAWKEDDKVPGAKVHRRRKVVYEAAPTSLSRMTEEAQLK